MITMGKDEQLAEYQSLRSRRDLLQYELAATESRLDTLSGKVRELNSTLATDREKALKLLDELVCAELRSLLASNIELNEEIKKVETILAKFPH